MTLSQDARAAIADAPAPESASRPPPRARPRRPSDAPTPIAMRRLARGPEAEETDASPTQNDDDLCTSTGGSPEDDIPPQGSPPPEPANPHASYPAHPARDSSHATRDDPILMITEKSKWKPLTSGVNNFARWTESRMKASAFDPAQRTLSTPYLNSTAHAIDILFNMEHSARDIVVAAFIREAAREDDPTVLLEHSGMVQQLQHIQKYLSRSLIHKHTY